MILSQKFDGCVAIVWTLGTCEGTYHSSNVLPDLNAHCVGWRLYMVFVLQVTNTQMPLWTLNRQFICSQATCTWYNDACKNCASNEFYFIIDKLLAHVEQELKRLQRRKVFASEDSSSSTHSQLQSQATGSGATGKDQPLFTLKQVTVVCQRMLKEREEQIRGEYDKVLTTKLAGV